MHGKTLLGLFLATAACSTAGEPASDSFLPSAPLGELALPADHAEVELQLQEAPSAVPADAPAAAATAMPAVPRLVAEPAETRVYGRTADVEHTFHDQHGRRMQVMLRFAFGASPAQAEAAQQRLQQRWTEAVAATQKVLGGAELTTDDGVLVCEERLCRTLTETLFTGHDGEPIAAVERVVWRRLRWN